MNTDERRLIRQIIRQVHPDLFAANPYERQCNSDSLQVNIGSTVFSVTTTLHLDSGLEAVTHLLDKSELPSK